METRKFAREFSAKKRGAEKEKRGNCTAGKHHKVRGFVAHLGLKSRKSAMERGGEGEEKEKRNTVSVVFPREFERTSSLPRSSNVEA